MKHIEKDVAELVESITKVAERITGKAGALEVARALHSAHGMLRRLVEERNDTAIDMALWRLTLAENGGDRTASVALVHARILLKAAVLEHETADGRPLELKLLPILLPQKVELVPARAYRRLIDVWDAVEGAGELYFIDPRPWPLDTVLQLAYRDFAILAPEDGMAYYRREDSPEDDLEDEMMAFIAIWRYLPEVSFGPAHDDIQELAEHHRQENHAGIFAKLTGPAVRAAETALEGEREAAQSTARILGETLNGPTAVQAPADPIDARAQGWGLLEYEAAKEGLASQLAMATAGPAHGATGAPIAVSMAYSVHGESLPPELGTDWVPRELRLSLLNRDGALIARHAVHLTTWYRVDAAIALAQELAEELGIGHMDGIMERQELADDQPGEPLYFQGKQYLPWSKPSGRAH